MVKRVKLVYGVSLPQGQLLILDWDPDQPDHRKKEVGVELRKCSALTLPWSAIPAVAELLALVSVMCSSSVTGVHV